MTNNNEMTIFENKQFGNVRTMMVDGEPWFAATDVCRCIGVGNASSVVNRLSNEEKQKFEVDTNGGIQAINFVNKNGLMVIICSSRKGIAKRAKDWFSTSVFPALGIQWNLDNVCQQETVCESSELSVFNNAEFGSVRVQRDKNGEPWFVAVDVCKILAISDTSQAMERIDDEDKRVFGGIRTANNTLSAWCVNEPGLYSLILESNKPEARAFKHWITHEVLPVLRKKGSYSMNDQQMEIPKDYPSALRALADQVESNLALVEQNAALTSQNKILSGEILKWDSPALLNAIIRKYGHVVCGDKFGCAWKAFYKELLYKHSINLESRKTNDVNKNPKNQNRATYKYLAKEEWQSAIETAVALCSAADVDISDILKANIEETAIVA